MTNMENIDKKDPTLKDFKDRIWFELYNAKFREYYCSYILDKKLFLNKSLNTIIIFFSITTIIAFEKNKTLAIISAIINAFAIILNFIFQNIIPSERTIIKLEEVVSFYISYYNSLEKLWYKYTSNNYSIEEIQNEFYLIKNTEIETQKKYSSIIVRMTEKIKNKAEKNTKLFIDKIFR